MSKSRGSRTHGRGRKAGRGKGKRGGKGNAGLNAHKKSLVLKNPELYAPKKGIPSFKIYPKSSQSIINLNSLSKLIQNQKITKEINLDSFGFDKVLGSGSFDVDKNKSIMIICKYFSKRAKKVIEDSGNKISIKE